MTPRAAPDPSGTSDLVDGIKKNDYSFSIPKLDQATLDRRRQHILRAAELCFARDGFHATTIADVRKQAGVSTGAIYTYFPDKESMIRAILERARDDRRRQLEDVPLGTEGSLARAFVLLEWVNAIFSRQGGHAARVDVNLWAEALRNERVKKIARGALHEATLAVSAVATPRSREAGVDPNAVASVLIALFLGLEVQTAVGMPLQRDEVVRVLTSLFAEYLPGSRSAGKGDEQRRKRRAR